jgi:hypothetical protein
LLLLPAAIHGADLTSLGDWTETLTASHLSAGAGSDLPNQLESIAGVTTLTITNAPGAWTLRARRSGKRWNNDFALFVKRTSAGVGSGSISGGEGYVEITGSNGEIFEGAGSRSSISLQFKLTGLASNVAAETYFSSIIFTVQ